MCWAPAAGIEAAHRRATRGLGCGWSFGDTAALLEVRTAAITGWPLDLARGCDTLCHMKTVSIRELHERTGDYVRQVAKSGEIYVTDRGRTVARIVPEQQVPEEPYFARRKLTRAFRKLLAGNQLRGGTDSTQTISEEREERGT